MVFLCVVFDAPRPPVRSIVSTPPSGDQVYVFVFSPTLVVITSLLPSILAVATASFWPIVIFVSLPSELVDPRHLTAAAGALDADLGR